jgi:putative phosphoribosyl transferase
MSLGLRNHIDIREMQIGAKRLPATLRMPADAFALVVFAHGSGSSRLSPRNVEVAEALNSAGLATLLFDLLTAEEESSHNRAKVFDIPLLADRLTESVGWMDEQSLLAHMAMGLFAATTGAAAALVAAARMPTRVSAVVSRGGRPDLAGDALLRVVAPTLLIVGGADFGVIELNEGAFAHLTCLKKLEIVPGVTHLFPEPGAMERVIALTEQWFAQHLRT